MAREANKPVLLFSFILTLFGCRTPTPPPVVYDRTAERVIAEGFKAPQSISRLSSDGDFIVSHQTEGGKGAISRITKGKIELLVENLISPRGLSFDERRAEIYVVDGNVIKIIKLKKLQSPPTEIVVPTKGKLNDIAYSLFNRRAYVTDSADSSIWEINPDKKSAKLIFGPEAFIHLHVGSIYRVVPTHDGSRLYLTTALPEGAPTEDQPALLLANLREKSISIRRRFEGLKVVSGFDLYQDRYLVTDTGSGSIESYGIDIANGTGQIIPINLALHPVDIAVDLSSVVVLDLQAKNGSGRLVQIPLYGNKK